MKQNKNSNMHMMIKKHILGDPTGPFFFLLRLLLALLTSIR